MLSFKLYFKFCQNTFLLKKSYINLIVLLKVKSINLLFKLMAESLKLSMRSANSFMKNDQYQIQKSQNTNTINATQNQKRKNNNQQKVIRDDIFLIKIKVLNANFEDKQDLYTVQNFLNQGKFSIRSYERSSFQITSQQYKKKIIKEATGQLDFRQRMRDYLFGMQKIEYQIKQKLKGNQTKNGVNLQKKHADQYSPIKKQKKKKTDTNATEIFRQFLISNQKIQFMQKFHANKKYYQCYRFPYKRQLTKKKQVKKVKQQINIFLQIFNVQKSLELNNKPTIEILERNNYINQIFTQNFGYMFSGTIDGFIELKFKQNKINKWKSESSENAQLQSSNIFWGKFPLKPFISQPFVKHKIELKLTHKFSNTSNQSKDKQSQININKNSLRQQRKSGIISFQMFCVPGQKSTWGQIKITKIYVKNLRHQSIQENKGSIILDIIIQFPDWHKIQNLKKSNAKTSINVNALSLEHDENGIWDQNFAIDINSHKNIVVIKLVRMERDRKTVIEVIGQNEVDLLLNGYLIDEVLMTKHLGLYTKKQLNRNQGQKVGDLSIQFIFEMKKRKYEMQENGFYRGQNSFVDVNALGF